MTASYGHRCRNMRVGLVIHNLEIIKPIIKYTLGTPFDMQPWQRQRLTCKLQPCLFQMITVQMRITASPDELARLQVALLRDHLSQQRIGGNIERYTQKSIRRALIKLARQPTIRHIKLKQRMTGR